MKVTLVKSKSILILLILLSACATYKPFYKGEKSVSDPYSKELVKSVFLLSGASQDKSNSSPTFELLKSQVNSAGDKASLFLMGNNGTKYGLPDSVHSKKRREAESILHSKLSSLKDFSGDLLITAGYRDWASGGKKGYKNVTNLERYVESLLNKKGNVFLPDNGCPGPQEVHLSEGLVAIVIDTQWWLHEWEKPGQGSSCEAVDEGAFLIHLKDALVRNKDKKVIVVGSHPIYSNGPHGGYFPVSTHLLPPVLGTIYAGYRKYIGNLQDLYSPKYKAMRIGLIDLFKSHSNLIYVSGHEKSMQYHNVKGQHYVVSGSIADTKPVRKGKTADFAYAENGFGKLNFYNNGDAILEFWVANGEVGELVYSKKLFNHIYSEAPKVDYGHIDFSGQVEKSVADAALLIKGQKKPGPFGKNYREEWAAELEAPVFDIAREHGGLKILKRGGGLQTRTLRLEDTEGKQYVLRSIEKFPEAAIPSILRKTFVSRFVKDQLSASHPYAALVVGPMADAAGVYHTNPKLVYVKDDPRFGDYREDFKNAFYIYEERPAKNRSDVSSFGNSKKIISTLDVIKKIKKNHKSYVDQELVVRSRLFDIFLGDWDRHEDQWRWASFKDENKRTYYQPIPRDRDHAFFYGDGGIMKLASHRWGVPMTQGFHHEIRDVIGLEFIPRHFDRSFLTDLSEQEWLDMAQELKISLTDEVIEQAIRTFPKPLYDLNGETIISKLKSRRDKLDKYAREYYAFLAKTIDVLGTKKREIFEVIRLNEAETQVKVSAVNKKGNVKRLMYNRVFKANETKEVRLYGFGGDDKFKISGNTRKGIKVRVIGGKGDDHIEDSTPIKGGNKVLVYDQNGGIELVGAGLKDRTSNAPDINYYNRTEFEYDKLAPLARLSYNPDDAVIFGGGFSFTKHKFRKLPFATRHKLAFDLAPRTTAFNINYLGIHKDVLGKWDYLLEVDVHEPSFTDAFYGFGNKSTSDEDIRDGDRQFYIARYSQFSIKNSLSIDFSDDRQQFRFGGFFNSVNVERDDNLDEDRGGADRFITTYPDMVGRGEGSDSPLLDKRRKYIGGEIGYSVDYTDSEHIPTRGFRYNIDGKAVTQMGDELNSYQQISSDVSFYVSTGGTFKTTFATRLGGAVNFGDFEFYQAVKLGGTTNHRGYRKFRFAGDQSVYQNTEMRIKLFNFRSRLLGSFGLIAFHDVGRVWSDSPDVNFIDDTLDDWHRGYGGGIWMSPLNQIALSLESATSSDEGNLLFFVRFGFMF